MKDLVNLMNHDAVTRLMSAFANGYYVEHETFTKKTLTFPVYLVMKYHEHGHGSELLEIMSVWTSEGMAAQEVMRLTRLEPNYDFYIDQRDVNKS